jgi:glycosyltransferase involved in cell wall biosynthesis
MAPLVAIDGRDAAAPQLRGWGRYARCLIDALQAEADEDLLIEVLADGGWGPELVFEQLRLPRALRRRGAALVHATNCFLPLRRPCPGVVTIHDLAFEAWPDDFAARTRIKYRLLAPRAARSAELIICPSAFTRDDVCERYGVDPGKVRVIPEAPALPISEARALPIPEASALPIPEASALPIPEAPPDTGETPYVLAVGDLRRKKNLGALVQAFARLHRDRAVTHRLVLAGADTGEGARLRELSGAAPVELTGYVSDAALDGLIRGADLLVNPSLYEGFGLVNLEAMTRGTPVLAARAGALPEAGSGAAAYFEPGEPDGLRAALDGLLADPRALEDMAARGLEWVARFSWERTARETAAVYRELV